MGGGRAVVKIVFFGTPVYVLPILKAVHKKFVSGPGKSPIAAVVTQPPKPVGRKKIPTYSPVDKWAHEHGIPIYYSADELLENSPDARLGILASYGEIIKRDVINLFPQGILIIHPSLLPKYRGASPVPAAIANGDAETGISIIKMDEKMDHGPVISQSKESISPDDTSDVLRDRLFEKSADVLAELLPYYIQGKIKPKKQDDAAATYTKLLKREDGFIDLTKEKSAIEIDNFIRSMTPWPGAWTWVWVTANGKKVKKRLKLLRAHLENSAAGNRTLILDQVQLEGKYAVTWKQFEEGYKEAFFAEA